MKLRNIAFLMALLPIIGNAKPVVNMTPNTKGGISKTIVETWNLSDDEKKSSALMMSQISATAVAPTVTVKKGNWTALNSKHVACFYNTFGTQVAGKYQIRFVVAGKEVNAFDAVPVNPGQAYCVTRYLEIWVRGERPGSSPSDAYTHVEQDGNSTDNEGHGTVTVR
jgi:hypothetical protein